MKRRLPLSGRKDRTTFGGLSRSALMSRVRSSGNATTELKLLALLRAARVIGWRRKQHVVGKPDFVFHRERLAVFVDGCFWHGCPAHCRMPRSRVAFWSKKISRNKNRDREVGRLLRRRGWRVVRIWEHALRNADRVVARLQAALASRGGKR